MRRLLLLCPSRHSRGARGACAAAFLVALAAGACRSHPPAPAPEPAPVPEPPHAPDVTTGEQVLGMMHDRYAGHWYRTLTFRQRTTIFTPRGDSIVQTWYEAGAIPGRLRIDTDVPSKGNGVLYANDSLYSFSSGQLVSASRQLNDLAILGFDVYGQPLARTVAQLGGQGFDLTRLREDRWRGRPVWIVGRVAPDTASREFWVEQERLLFVRLLETRVTPQHATLHSDVRFGRYAPHGGGWVAEEVTQFVDGKPRVHEAYSGVRVDVPLSPALFDPRQWGRAPHWYKP